MFERRSSSSNGRDCAFVRKRTATSAPRPRPARGRDPRDDLARLVALLVEDGEAHVLAARLRRLQRLAEPAAVLGDDGSRGLQDRRRRAVVALEADRLRRRELARELQDVRDVGAAPAVDRLVLVAHDEEVPGLARDEAHELRLDAVRVLVFVHEEVPDAPPEQVAHAVVRRDEARREDEEVVEVERLRRAQRLLVGARDVREAGAEEVAEAAREIVRLDALVLRLRDARLDLARRRRLLGQGDFLHRALHDGELVVRVEDDEALRHARLVRKAPEEAHAPGVERPDERARPLGARGARATRSFISPAALFVNVTATTASCGTPCATTQASRRVRTRVFPDPAPARTRSGPSPCDTAAACSGLRPSRRSSGRATKGSDGSAAAAASSRSALRHDPSRPCRSSSPSTRARPARARSSSTTRGAVRGMAQQEIRQIYPEPGWVEHDPTEIWATQSGVMHEALAKAGITGRDVAAIGITNQRETTLLWERATGRPLANAIVWQDRRTAPTVTRSARPATRRRSPRRPASSSTPISPARS